jgi:hypothetical protein
MESGISFRDGRQSVIQVIVKPEGSSYVMGLLDNDQKFTPLTHGTLGVCEKAAQYIASVFVGERIYHTFADGSRVYAVILASEIIIGGIEDIPKDPKELFH